MHQLRQLQMRRLTISNKTNLHQNIEDLITSIIKT